MKRVILYSVPHTGTRFWKHALEYLWAYTQGREGILKPGQFTQVHTQDGVEVLNTLMQNPDVVMVVPVRDPYLNYISCHQWAHRKYGADKKASIRNWATLIAATTRMPYMLCPVDGPKEDRVRLLGDLGRFLDVPLVHRRSLDEFAANWTPVGASGKHEDLKNEYHLYGTINNEVPTFLDFTVQWLKDEGVYK